MSLRYEQYRSLVETRQLLHDIIVGRAGNTHEVKARASMCARHFPYLDETGAPMFSNDGFDCPPTESAYKEMHEWD